MKYKATVLLMILLLLTNIAPFIFVERANTVLASPSSLETIEVSRPVQLTTDPSYDRDGSFLEDQYGTYWLFFTRGRNDTANPDNDFYDVYYLKSTNGGATWTEHSLPNSVNDNYGQREIAVFEYEDLIVVYFTDAFWTGSPGAPTNGVYRVYSNDNGTTWSSVLQVPGVTGYHIDVIAALGKIWVFYEGPGALINVISWDSGTGWSTPVQISESGKHGGIPKAMLDEDDNLNVVWCGWTEGGIYRSTSSDGTTWSTPQLVLTSTYVACDPVLVQDLSGTYWLFWAPWDSATDSQWLEVVNSTDGTTWSSSRHVTSGGYGGNYWWDMWPEAYVESSGDMLLFYGTEVSGGGAGGYVKGDGNIWMFEVDWDLTNDHYEFIQNAIDDAPPGETILVHDGTYYEALYINKSLTIKAASTPTIEGSQSVTTSYGNRDAVIFVEDATNVIIEGFDVEGQGLGTINAKNYGIIFEESSGAVKQCTVSPNTIGDMNSVGIGAWDSSDLRVESCVIENFGRIGVFYFSNCLGGVYDSTIIGQVYSDEGKVNYGIEIEAYDSACDIEIVGNEVYDCDNTHPSPSWSSAGIMIDGWLGLFSTPSSAVIIKDNDIYNNYYGVEVVANPNSYAHYNNIYNNREYGVIQDSDFAGNNETFDARFNWWGDASGPYHNTSWTYMGVLTIGPNYGSGDRVTDHVLYEPWLQSSWPPTTLPTLRVEPSSYTATSYHETFDINITISDVLAEWGVQALMFRLQFNATLLEVVDVTEGPFMGQAGDTWFSWIVEYSDPLHGDHVLVGTVLLPQIETTSGGVYTDFPEGSGTVATITFRAIYQQIGLENPPLACNLTLTDTLIINPNQVDIEHGTEDGYYEIWPWPTPTMRVEPESYTAKTLNETFSVDVEVTNLHASLMKAVSVQFRLLFNGTLLEITDVTEGPLMQQAGATFFVSFVDYFDPAFGSNVVVGILIYPQNETGEWTSYANGTGTLATITFKSVYQHVGLENPPLSCNLTLVETIILDENLEDINHTIENWGSYEILPNNIADINWDNKVDIRDVSIVAQAYGSMPGHPRWNPVCDLNQDSKVDIRDVSIVARNFGWTPDP